MHWFEAISRRIAMRSMSADLDLAAFVCVTTVEALTHAAVLRNPEVLAADRVDGFIEEASRLIVGYLRRGDDRAATDSRPKRR